MAPAVANARGAQPLMLNYTPVRDACGGDVDTKPHGKAVDH
jgi:hypothetical protein